MTQKTIKKNATELCAKLVRMVVKLPFRYRIKVALKIISGRS